MAHFNFVISQNSKWQHAGFYIDCHRMTVPENILLQKKKHWVALYAYTAEDVTLAASSAEDRLQSGSADVQSPQHIDAVVPPSPNPGPTTQPQPAIDYYDLSRRRLLRSVLTDAVLRLSRTHYRKTVVDSDSVVVFKSV